MLYPEGTTIHVHVVRLFGAQLHRIRILEHTLQRPLSAEDLKKANIHVDTFFEPGVHAGVRVKQLGKRGGQGKEEYELVFLA